MSTITEHAVRLSTRNKVGLVLAGLLGLGDIVSLAGPNDDGAGAGPPTGVLIADAILGVITLIAVVIMWRTGSRAAGRVVAGSRILSAITALPAFFVADVPAVVVVMVSVFVIVTAITCYLVLSRPADDLA